MPSPTQSLHKTIIEKRILLITSFFILFLIQLYPVAATTNITACTTLNATGDYQLNSNITTNTSGSCILIGTDNITVDCQGFSISQNETQFSGIGFDINSRRNISITNCRTENFSEAVLISSGTNITISNSSMFSNRYGVSVSSTNSSLFENLEIGLSSISGMSFTSNSAYNIMGNITSYNNTENGIILESSPHNMVENSEFQNNTHGVEIGGEGGDNNTVKKSIFINNGAGIRIRKNASSNTISNSTFSDNFGALDFVDDGTGTTPGYENMAENNIVLNGTRGVYFRNYHNNQIINLTVSNLTGDAVSIENASNNTIINSNLSQFSIDVRGSSDNNTLLNLTFNESQINFQSGTVGDLFVKWYLTVNITFMNSPEANVTAEAFDQNNNIEINTTTDSSGVLTLELSEYKKNITDTTTLTPHTINISKNGFSDESGKINLTESTSLQIQLLQIVSSCAASVVNDSALDQNLSCGGTGLFIDAPNVLLDCKNFNITGPGSGFGIDVEDVDNITIRNCRIYNFGTEGIHFMNSSFGLIEYNDVSNQTSSHGIVITSYSHNNTIRFNTANYNFFTGLIAIESTSTFNLFYNNTAIGNKDHGMEIENGAHHNTFANNTLTENNFTGIKLSPSTHNNTVTGNIISGGHGQGIDIYNSSGNIVDNNNITNHPAEGIVVEVNSSGNAIYNNYIQNSSEGVRLSRTTNNTNITNNVIEDTSGGIAVENSSDVIISGNTLTSLTVTELTIRHTAVNVTLFGNVFTEGNKMFLQTAATWDNGSIGNRWGVYDQPSEGCEDSNNNGICDSLYIIDSNNTDFFPLALVSGTVSGSGEDGNSGGGSGGAIVSNDENKKPVSLGSEPRTVGISKGETLNFTAKGENHSIKIINITQQYVELGIASNPFDMTLEYGVTETIDLDGNGIDDIELIAEYVSLSKVNITISLLSGVEPNCNDGVRNQGEEGIDCGGSCTSCQTSQSNREETNETPLAGVPQTEDGMSKDVERMGLQYYVLLIAIILVLLGLIVWKRSVLFRLISKKFKKK